LSDHDTYDIVIVGGGLGGLLCGVILAKEGMKVCILEKDQQIGGCLQTFSVHKTIFDSCVHYIGGLGEGHTLSRIFEYAGIMGKLKLKPLDEDGFDRIAFGQGDTVYPQAVGMENFVEQLSTYFPNERVALDAYVRKLRYVGDHFPLYRLRTGSADEKAVVTGWPLTQTLSDISGDLLLQQVLAGNNLLYAGVSGKTPFFLHSLVTESYIHSAHKVVPGSSEIAKLLWRELQAHGGVIHRNTSITRLVEEDGLVSFAESETGQRYYGKQFISGIHPEATLNLIESKLIRPAYRNRIKDLEQTISSFMLNLVLQPGKVPHRNYNLYWHAERNVWSAIKYKKSEWPAGYALYFTESGKHPGFAESLSILCYMRYEEVEKWRATSNRAGEEHERGADYEEFKAVKSDLLLEKVYERIPELKGNIVAQAAATPLTYRDYTGAVRGGLYGILKDVENPAATTIAIRTRIPNLLLTGQNVNLHGVLGVSITALATCAELIGMDYLLNKVNNR
jgi:all-trans-retinol 13,14-reductase